MSNYGPVDAWIIVGGNDVTGDIFDMQESAESALEEVHPFLGGAIVNAEKWLPVGIAKILLECGQGVYDTRAAGMLEAFQNSGTIRQTVAYGFGGTALGAEVVMVDGDYVAQFTKKATRSNITFGQSKHTLSGRRYTGRLVAPMAALTGATGDTGATAETALDQLDYATAVAITSSEADDDRVLTAAVHGLVANDDVFIAGHTGMTPNFNGWNNVAAVPDTTHFTMTGVDITADGSGGTVKRVSSAGCILDLHVATYVAGGASDLIVYAEMSDDVTGGWSPLAEFAPITAAGSSERIVVAAGTQVKRFIMLSWEFTGGSGSSSFTPVLGVYRT